MVSESAFLTLRNAEGPWFVLACKPIYGVSSCYSKSGRFTTVNMAYSTDMRVAAHRHFKSAQVLCAEKGAGLQPGCRAVAGYLFGLSGELAVKKIMKDSGMPPLPPERRRDDPYFAHFPALKKMLSIASGRRSEELRRIAENSSLFQNWDTNMRYAPTKDIQKNDIDAWEASAKALVESMEAE